MMMKTSIVLLLSAIATINVPNVAAAAESKNEMVELYLLPHTHADVGWLETVDALARVNVSRILNGVTGNLMNDTLKRRRFVWDEMAFLQLWWDETATDEQKADFTALVKEGRIEFVDNGWSQHDMGCTTLDSMVSNWEEGHLWLLKTFGESAQPKIGWSLDPFGMSTTQAVLQALMGMEAWFFTRLSDDVVSDMKANQGLEFIWRASSALSAQTSEIFSHVYESYYCMPLPTYAFEWGSNKGAEIPNAENIIKLSKGLATIAKQRAPWFRTPNVLIPWGCDYQFQNSELVYKSTDWLIDTINMHPEWGVHVQYTTPSEYLAAVQESAQKNSVKFPVKTNGSHFFPFNGWSGYFTSRPSLKGNSAKAVSQLLAAESLFSLQVPPGSPQAKDMWGDLELARRNNGIVQHHDAITGTGCENEEGCSGNNQLVGAHNVIDDYQTMLSDSLDATAKVATSTLELSSGVANLTLDAGKLGKILEGEGNGFNDAVVVIYNPLGIIRTEAVHIPIPMCSGSVSDASTNKSVMSQITSSINIGDGQAPYFDFELQFLAVDLPPFGHKSYRISPTAGECGGGDLSVTSTQAKYHKHEKLHPRQPVPLPQQSEQQRQAVFSEAKRRQGEVCGDPQRWLNILAQVQSEQVVQDTDTMVVMENAFMRIYVDTKRGVQMVYDKASNKNISLTHDLMKYTTNTNDAYAWSPVGPAVPVLSEQWTAENCTAWRQTANCDPNGKVQPNLQKPCTAQVLGKESGFCDCNGVAKGAVGCDLNRPNFTCQDICAASGQHPTDTLQASVALGPVLQEVRIQVSSEFSTRIRLWVSDDPEVGGRIEFAHRIGVLEQQTEISSRFSLGEASVSSDPMQLYSEDNGYEAIPHTAGTGANNIPDNMYPSQQSCFIANATTQLSLALERSHAVGSLVNGTLEVVQHRRGAPFDGQGITVVLDDTDRIFTQTWLAVGDREAANRARVSMKIRLNHPLVLAFAAHVPSNSAFKPESPQSRFTSKGVADTAVHMQSVRSISPDNSQVLVRLQHLFTIGEDSTMSSPQTVNLDQLLPGRSFKSFEEMTLDGMRNVNTTQSRVRFPAEGDDQSPRSNTNTHTSNAAANNLPNVVVNPFELRTFRAV